MVKRGSSTFSAASVAKGSVVLSRAIEKNFALEAEVSRLRHHVSVQSQRLHSITIERDGLLDTVNLTVEIEDWGAEPQVSEGVAEKESNDGATSVVAGMSIEGSHSVADEGVGDATSVAEEEEREATSVADEGIRDATSVVDEDVPEVAQGCNRFAIDLVDEGESVPVPVIPSGLVEAVIRWSGELENEGDWPGLGTPNTSTGVVRVTHSSDEDVVLGGVIVASGASQRAKKNRRRKRKNRVDTGWV